MLCNFGDRTRPILLKSIFIIVAYINCVSITKLILANQNMESSFFTIPVFVLCYYGIKQYYELCRTGQNIFGYLFTFLFSNMLITGSWMRNGMGISGRNLLLIMFYSICFWPNILYLLHLLNQWIDEKCNIENGNRITRKETIIVFSIIYCFWFFSFLAYYPGNFGVDPDMQLTQVIENSYLNTQPMIHTLLIGICYKIGKHFNSMNMTVALYTLFQMFLMDCAIMYAYRYIFQLVKTKVGKIYYVLFFAVFPVNLVLVVVTTKDILFTAFLLVFIIYLHRLILDYSLIRNIPFMIGFVINGTLMCLFRNNAKYALVLCAIFVMMIFWKDKKIRNTILISMLMVLICLTASNKVINQKWNVYIASPREALSIPFQQIARVYVQEENKLSSDMKNRIHVILPDVETYMEHLSDPIKSKSIVRDHLGEIFSIWKELWIEYPDIYIEAFLQANIGSWYIDDVTNANVYGSGSGYLLTGYTNEHGGEHISFFPQLEAWIHYWFQDNHFLEISVISILFTPSLYFWLVFLVFTLSWIRHYKGIMTICSLFLAYHMTLMLGPCSLIRYLYPFLVCLPLMIAIFVNEVSKKNILNS